VLAVDAKWQFHQFSGELLSEEEMAQVLKLERTSTYMEFSTIAIRLSRTI